MQTIYMPPPREHKGWTLPGAQIARDKQNSSGEICTSAKNSFFEILNILILSRGGGQFSNFQFFKQNTKNKNSRVAKIKADFPSDISEKKKIPQKATSKRC